MVFGVRHPAAVRRARVRHPCQTSGVRGCDEQEGSDESDHAVDNLHGATGVPLASGARIFRRVNWLLVFIPIAVALEYVVHAPPAWIFATAIVGIIPLAEWIRRATEHLAESVGSAIGGLLNVTFGNAAELIIALFVLRAGHGDVVKAQITGAIIGNSLLGLGLAIVAGSIGRHHQSFSRQRAGQLGSML